MTQKVILSYTTVKGKNVDVVLESKAKAKETLRRLKKLGVVRTYNKGRCARAVVFTAQYCPICKKILPPRGKTVVDLLNPPTMKQLTAHRSCCEHMGLPYRLYVPTDKKEPNKVIYPR